MKKEPIIVFKRQDYCPKCHKDKSIILVDAYGKPINYPLILDTNQIERLNKSTFTHMHCKNCGSDFFINWNDGLPKPMDDMFYHIFMEHFKNTKIF